MSDCVWIHGTSLPGLRWHEALPGGWPLLPGHGGAPRVEPSVAAYADALAPTLPERFVVGGHSLGGMVALELAARYADRCRALVLVDTPLRAPNWVPRLPGLVPLFGWPRLIGFVFQFRTSNRAMRSAIRRTISATPRAGLLDAMRAALLFDGRPLRDKLAMPVLSLLGGRSLLTGRADAIGDSRTFEDCGHLLPFDRPDDTLNTITDFLESHP